MKMRPSTVALLLLALATFAWAEKPSEYGDRPRGVPLSKGALYQEDAGDFECLDGKKKIPFEQVNDDYCDCDDGSDEPGTSACSNGKFHCLNIGHRALDIPSSRVNDHICDCCDGSDEWEELVSCPNVCSELGAQAREDAQKRAATQKAGFEERKKLVAEGQSLKAEKYSNVEKFKAELEALKPQKDELLAKKDEIEAKEKEAKDKHDNAWNALQEEKRKAAATAIFGQIDKDGDDKITVKEIQEFAVFDKDADGTVSEEEAKSYLKGGEEADFQNYLDNLHHDIKDVFSKPAETEKKTEEAVEDEGESDDGVDDLEDIDSEYSKHEEQQEVKPPYDEETQKLIEEADKARTAFNDINRKVSNLESDIRDAETFAEQDFGPDFVWAALKGQCLEKVDNQYTYKLCLFDKAVQKDRGSEVSLGYWNAWTGSETAKYSEQTYNNGQGCWNGPNRSTKVVITCGERTELTEVSEPSKCEYMFVMTSPAACEDPEKDPLVHTEL